MARKTTGALVLLAALALAAGSSESKPGRERKAVRTDRAAQEAPTVSEMLQGKWCVDSDARIDEAAHAEDPLDAVRARMRKLRQLDGVRIVVKGDRIELADGLHMPSVGKLSVAMRDGQRYLTIDWLEPAEQTLLPDQPVAYGRGDYGIDLSWETPDAREAYHLDPATDAACMTVDERVLRYRDGSDLRAPLATESAAAPWASLPPARWPQLVLTNEAVFFGSTRLEGASAFLVDVGGRVVVGTAKHLIGDAGGVEPAIPLAGFNERLELWKLSVRTRATPFVRATRLAMKELERAERSDWLWLALEPKAKLPSTPLVVRTTPVQLNERVYLVGCQYRDVACKQRVYAGRVTGRMGNGGFRYELDEPIVLRGFSGAPVVDTNGHLVGMMTVMFSTFMVGEANLEAGGQDASVGLWFLEDATDPGNGLRRL